jgi:hypothetical protein
VTDLLERLDGPAGELLARVDDVLVARGLPAGHPIVDLLRRLGALPADAARAISAQRSAPLRAAGSELRRHADAYETLDADMGYGAGGGDGADGGCGVGRGYGAGGGDGADFVRVGADTGWRGTAAERFEAQRSAVAAHLTASAGRIRDTAAYLDEVADWIDRSRHGLAGALADALGSIEAVRLREADGDAAATIGARVLGAVYDAHEAGRDLARRWAGRLDEIGASSPTILTGYGRYGSGNQSRSLRELG